MCFVNKLSFSVLQWEQETLVGLWAPSLIDNIVHIFMKQKSRASGACAGKTWFPHNANCRKYEMYQGQQHID